MAAEPDDLTHERRAAGSIRRLSRVIFALAGFGLLAVLAYLLFWPVPAEPRSWRAPAPPGYSGPFAPNNALASLQAVDIGEEYGPEHLAIGPDGKLYAAMTSGNLLRMDPDGAKQEVFASTGGRVLGFAFDSKGRMIAADAMRGLLLITPEGEVSVLADQVGPGDAIQYANSVTVGPDDVVYFTDASTRFAPREWGGTYEASVFGPTQDRARQMFQAEIHIGAISLRGDGECLALMVDTPEPGLHAVRCELRLSGLPEPYVGGLLTTNTLTSQARFGGETRPTGYTQASIATIRLWKGKPRDDRP